MGRLSKFFDKPEKWVQGTLVKAKFDGTKCYCILGGYAKVSGLLDKGIDVYDIRPTPTLKKIYNALSKKWKSIFTEEDAIEAIYNFNDDKTTTFKKVKNLLAKAGV